MLVGWRWQFHAMGVLALVLPLPMVWFLVRDSAEQHPRVSAAEAALVTAGTLSRNEDAPGRAARERGATWNNYRFWLATTAIASNAIFFWGLVSVGCSLLSAHRTRLLVSSSPAI